jgi:predicted outer membrane repeat protein
VLTFLRRYFTRRPIITKTHRTIRLALEPLEDRCTPAVLTVNSVADNTAADGSLTLREAIQIVNGNLGHSMTTAERAQVSGTLGTGDTIQFNLPAGPQTITLTGGMLSLTRPVTINGPGASALTVSGNAASRVFYVGQSFSQNLGLTVALGGLTIANGKDAYGAGLFNAGTLTLTNVAFTGNTATTNGGGGLYNNGSVTLNGCTFTNNTTLPNGTSATAGGALLNITAGTVTATGCTFTGNTAPGTGAAAGQGGALANTGAMTVTNSTISNNSAAFGGGGIFNGNGPLALTNCTVANNTVTPNNVTPTQGGGLLNELTGTVTLTGCTFTGNSAQGSGQYAGQGGGVYNSGGTATVNGGSFTGNSAASDGGGFYTRITGANNLVAINNVTFANNYSASDGGAIRAHYSSIVSVTGCTFVGNNASSEGGAIDGSVAAQMTITNSTFTNNYAGSIGGALNCGLGIVAFVNDTITGNRVGATYGGGINIRSTGISLQNTIVAGNYQGSGTTPNDITGYNFSSTVYKADPSSSCNIVGRDITGGLVNGTNGNRVGVAGLGLGPLASNGGPTQTMALLPGSPAIDHGNNAFAPASGTDQRGLARVVNGTIDIGAFEVQAAAPTVVVVNSTADNITADNVLTLREAIAFVDGTLGRALTASEQAQITGTMSQPTIQFSLPSGAQTITLTGGALNITQPVSIAGPGATLLTVTGNNADRVFVVGYDYSQNLALKVAISGLTVTGGSAVVSNKNYGGGLLNFGTLTLSNVTFSANAAGSSGGGAIYNDGAVTVTGATFSNNTVINGGPGGAIQNTSSATLTVNACSFTGNTATGGASGAAIASSGTLTVTASTFTGNTADSNGGGIYNSAEGTLTVTTTTFASNTAGSDGGGVDNDGSATITASTFSANTASSEGGGLASKGPLALTNCTFYGNTATSDGGGVQSAGAATLTNCTITANRVTHGTSGVFGGGLYTTGTTRVFNTIIAGNFQGAAPSSTANDIAGTLDASSAFNLIGTGGAGGLTNGVNNNLVGVTNPGLAPLANNGGPTQTVALLAGSSALDHGSNAYVTAGETDQRGLSRIANGTVDIGAFEAQ